MHEIQRPALKALVIALTCALPTSRVLAAPASADTALAATVQKLLDRVQQLEQRNQDLERRV